MAFNIQTTLMLILAMNSSLMSLHAQTTPVIAGPGGATSAAFWYLGGVTPSCCPELVNKYWTAWQVSLAVNTPNPSPTVQWFTDSPAKVSITQASQAGAVLQSIGHSSPGTTFDIHVWATVDGLESNHFPVFINRPWLQSRSGPSGFGSCATTIGASTPNGWVGRVQNSLTDLTGNALAPLPANESFENTKSLYPGQNWTSAPLTEASWPSIDWTGNSFFDVYAMCYATPVPPQAVIPALTTWNSTGGTAIYSNTQKYWIGSYFRFQGACTQRHALTWYTNHASLSAITTPITNAVACNAGQFAN